MTAAEAGAIELEEPDWAFTFQFQVDQGYDEKTPIELRQDEAFNRVLYDYRRFHFTWTDEGKRRPMASSNAVIALAILGIMPPRSRRADLPLGTPCFEEQHDDHCWLVNERAWRIVAIEDKTLCLDSFGDTKQVDLAAAKWDKYVEQRLQILQPKETPQ